MFKFFLLGAVSSKYDTYSLGVAEMVNKCFDIMIHIYFNYILDHDRVHPNVVHHLQGHVPGVTRQDNVARHIPKIKIKTMMIQVQ